MIQILIMLVSIRILTTLLSPAEVGNYYLAISILAFFNLVFLNPPGVYFSRHLLEWYKSKNLFNALVLFLLWILIVTLIAVPIVVILFEIFNYEQKFNYYMFLVFILLSIIISTVHRNITYGLNTIGHRKFFVYVLTLTLFFGLLFSVGLIYFFEPKPLFWLYGIIISETVIIYFAFKFFVKGNLFELKKIKEVLNIERFKKILIFTFPVAITTFLMWGQNMSYRFIVDYRYSAEILGYIAIGLGVASSIFGSLEAIMTQYLNPIFLKDILDSTKEERAKAWNKMASIMVPTYLLALIFIISMSEKLIFILADNQFHDSYHYTMIGAIVEFFRVASNLLNSISQSEMKTKKTILPYFIGFTVVIFSLVVFDFSHNLIMIPLVLVMGYFLVCLAMYINMNKLLEIRLRINFSKILIYSIPFGIIFLLPSSDNFFYNLFCLAVFGIYFLMINNSIIQEKA